MSRQVLTRASSFRARLKRALRALLRPLANGDRVFPIAPGAFRKRCRALLGSLGAAEMDPPQGVRRVVDDPLD